jgi:hypothetical protein
MLSTGLHFASESTPVSSAVVYNLRPPREARATAKLPRADGDCHTMDSEFLQDIALFREWRREANLAFVEASVGVRVGPRNS